MRTALVVAAHPDDEILGCGGIVARMVDEGWIVHHLILSGGAAARVATRGAERVVQDQKELRRAAETAAQIVGAAGVEFSDFPDNRMDSVDLLDIVRCVEATIVRHAPQRVLTHHASDVNIDHQLVHQAVAAAARPLPGASVRQLVFFETASNTEWRPSGSGVVFQPNLFVDINAQLDRKMAALNAYAAEMRAWPHPRSYEAVAHLAAWRGATIGVAAAEAFHIGRWVE